MRLLPAMFTFRRNVVVARALAAPDPADLGTAFGLDASLLETASAPTAPVALDDEPVSEPPLAWLSRRRRR